MPRLHLPSSLARSIAALRQDERRADEVHFHRGPDGRPVVCERSRCESPHLDV